MSTKGKGKSIMSELDKTEEELKECYHRLETLEKNLRFRPMTEDERTSTEKDVQQLRKILQEQEEEVKALRKENQNSTLFAVLLIIASFLIFGMYHMFIRQP